MTGFFRNEKTGPPPGEAPPDYPVVTGPSTTLPKNQFGTIFACLLLSRRDRIRLINFPETVIGPVQEAIQRVWASGIQNSGPFHGGGYEWKLSGNPWSGYGHEAVPSRRLLVHVLHALSISGWHLAFASDLTKKGYDKDSLYFRPGPPLQRYFFAISFNESDKVRLIDSPNPQVTDAFKAAVGAWPLGIQDTKVKEANCLQMKLRGTPWWTSDGAEVNHARLLACNLLGVMDAHGFELIGSVDMSVGSGDNAGDLDTWFFANKL